MPSSGGRTRGVSLSVMSTNQKRDDLWFSNTMRTEIWINLFGLPRRVVGLSALQGALSVDCVPHGVVSSGVSSRNFCFL